MSCLCESILCDVYTYSMFTPRSKRIRTLLLRLMQDPTMSTDGILSNVVTPLLQRMEKAIARLRAITNLNRNVHMAHYNEIIPEAAPKL